MSENKLFRCYDARFFRQVIPGLVAVLVLAFAGKPFVKGSPARIAVAIAVSLAFAYVIAVTMMSLRRLDELQQRIHLQAIAIAFALTGAMVTGASFIEHAGGPRLEPFGGWWLLMVLEWGMGIVVLGRRYR